MKIKYLFISLILSANTLVAATFGNTNIGTFTDTIPNGWINAVSFISNTNIQLNSISARLTSFAGRVKCAIYNNNNVLLGFSSEITSPINGLNNFSISPPISITNGQSYWLAVWSDDANAAIYYSDSLGTLIWFNSPYGTWPNQLAPTGSGNYKYCIYASGSVVSNPPPPSISTNNFIKLAWDAPVGYSNLTYNCYIGIQSRVYTNKIKGITNTTTTVSNLNSSTVYYFSVTTVDNMNVESDYSNEVFGSPSQSTNPPVQIPPLAPSHPRIIRNL